MAKNERAIGAEIGAATASLRSQVKGAAAGASVMVDQAQIIAVRGNIVTLSKKLEQDIEAIGKVFSADKFNSYWDSQTAQYYVNTVTSKINEIKTEQATHCSNLEKYLTGIVEKYNQVEKMTKKNAELFK